MLSWLTLLAGSLMFGLCVVAAMVLPRHLASVSVLVGIGGFVGALYTLGTIAQVYATPVAIGSAILVVVAGISLGYTIAASAIPHLSGTPRRVTAIATDHPGTTAVVLLGHADPERYDPVAVANRQNLLAESADIELPLTAVPFIFLTEKTRYRAIGGRSPGVSVAAALVGKVSGAWETDGAPAVAFASSHYPTDLCSVVEAHVRAGAQQVAIVSLDWPESAAADRSLAVLDAAADRSLGQRVRFAPSIWHDGSLVERLTERILASAGDTPLAHVGVTLACAGAPEAWTHRYACAGETENYFIQRVRARLTEAGLKCDHVRSAWLDWQTPDVTETVRHLAVLGCQRIICVPATEILPTLDTLLDLERASAYARVPSSVALVTLGAWGDDEVVAGAVRAAADSALGGADARDSGAL